MTLDEKARAQVARLLDALATERRPCVACGRRIWFVTTATGRKMPVTDDAQAHFVDCPKADELRARKKK